MTKRVKLLPDTVSLSLVTSKKWMFLKDTLDYSCSTTTPSCLGAVDQLSPGDVITPAVGRPLNQFSVTARMSQMHGLVQ